MKSTASHLEQEKTYKLKTRGYFTELHFLK